MEQQPTQPPVDPQKAFSAPLPPPPSGGQAAPPGGMPPGPQMGGVPPIPPGMPPFGPGPGRGGMPPMPPMPPMPMMYPPPPPPAPRHSFVRGILVTLATTIFGFSLMLNLYMLLAGGLLSGGASSRTTVIKDGDALQRIAVVPLKTMIMEGAAETFDKLLSRVEKEKNLKALIVEMDTPGGSVTASDEIHHRLKQFKSKHPTIPLIVSMRGMGTSGGYYVSCAADYIVAERTTFTGNIGVLMPRYNLSDLAKKVGVADNTITSTGAIYKNAGSMLKPDVPTETKYFQDLIDDAFGQFKAVIRDGRQGKLKKPLDEIANGKVYMADEALSLGLIDEIGYLDDAWAYAAKTAVLSNPSVVRYQETPSLTDLLLGGESKSHVPAPGVTLNISPDMIDRLGSPRLMYIWRAD